MKPANIGIQIKETRIEIQLYKQAILVEVENRKKGGGLQ